MVDENHIREVAAGHICEHNGVRYRVALVAFRLGDLPGVKPIAVDLDFRATPVDDGGQPVNLGLHLGLDNAEDDQYVCDAIDGTIRDIVDGKLPPGMKSLL
jgi:hypothetical protein